MFHIKFPHIRSVLIIMLVLSVVAVAGVAFAQDGGDEHDDDDEHPPHWAYEGEEGPDHWGALSSEFVACVDGTAQSPINITNAIGVDLNNIEFSYGDTNTNILNNGHTIQVNVDEGNSITYNEITYNLLQFHFHHPSEHIIEGEQVDMEIHLVHKEPTSGNLAVIGIFLIEGEENKNYKVIMDNMPPEESEVEDLGISITLEDLLPEQFSYFTYQGSLTTPPCSEIVRWLVLDTPIELSAEQIEHFASIFEINARPAQNLNSRDLLLDISE